MTEKLLTEQPQESCDTRWRRLKEPFDPMHLRWRVGQMRHDRTAARLQAYITAVAVRERLDAVLGPENWENAYQPSPVGGVECGIGIQCGDVLRWRWDAGDETRVEAVKGAHSDALKRAALGWGVGAYLRRLPVAWQPVREGNGPSGSIPIPGQKINDEWTPRSFVMPPILPDWAKPGATEAGPWVPPDPEVFRLELSSQLAQENWDNVQIRALFATYGAKHARELGAPSRAHAMTTILTTNGAAWTANQGA